tara:strand:- start:3225 stop:3590 length:366 start_codon:yes stop_codon:yes gene_type:complete
MKLRFPKIWSKKNNKLPLDITPYIRYTTLMKEKTTHTPIKTLPSNPIALASALTGKTLVYNAQKSTVVNDKTRVFKVQKVDDVFTSNSSGQTCVTVWANDIDQGGELVPRTLHVLGIESIS